MKSILLGLFLLLGFLFRLWIVNYEPQGFMLDQWEYDQAAIKILHNPDHLFLSSYRLPGYSLVLALIYSVFGSENTKAWIVFQAILDTLCALLVYGIAKGLFKNNQAVWIAFILYLFNPYTSAYVGVRLTEITAIFLITLIFYLFYKFLEKPKMWIILALSFSLGFLPQVRPGFLYFDIGILLIVFGNFYISFKRWKLAGFSNLGQSWGPTVEGSTVSPRLSSERKTKLISKSARIYKSSLFLFVVSLALFSLPFLYNIAANWKNYRQFAPMTVDNLFVREFYISLFIGNEETKQGMPNEVIGIYREYSTATTPDGRRAMADKYWKASIEEIMKNPNKFITSRLAKMWYVWEKHILYQYSNPDFKGYGFLVYTGNIIILAAGLFGLGGYWIKGMKNMRERWMVYLTVILIVYISVLHAFTITSERFSLPAYPMIMIFAGFGVWKIGRLLRSH